MFLCWSFLVSSLMWFSVPCIVGLVLATYWRNRKRNHCNIPSVSNIPIIITLFRHFVQKGTKFEVGHYSYCVLMGLHQLYPKEGMIKFGWAGLNTVLCFGANEAEGVLRNSSAIDKDHFSHLADDWLGSSLLLSGSDCWAKRRKMLNPAFHVQILRDFLVVFDEHSKLLIEELKKLDGDVVSITEILQKCTLDIVINTTMGIHTNDQEEECAKYAKAIREITAGLTQTVLRPLYWIKPIYYLSHTRRRITKNIKIARDFTRKIMQKRKAELGAKEMEEIIEDFQNERNNFGRKKRILLDLLLCYHSTDKSFKEKDITEEVDDITTTGSLTTTATLIWVLYLLGWHEEIQDKVYEEHRLIFSEEWDRIITINDLSEMKYLECVIKETLRLYPAIPLISRKISKDIKIGDYFVPANSSVIIPIYGIHHDPSLHPNPEIFNPDRFSPESDLTMHPFSYIPFLGGVRKCIGQRFAMMEIKTILSYILRNFKVCSLDHPDKLFFAADVVLRPTKPIRFTLEKRVKNKTP